jgi:hypothetical protein
MGLPMSQVTIIDDDVRTVDGTVAGDHVLVDPDRLAAALGWELKPEGLCQDSTCVPISDTRTLFVGSQLDLSAVAAALGRPTVVDAATGIIAVALPAELRHRALDGLEAPPFTLPDLDGVLHSLEEWRGRKKLLVAFSSW